MRQWCRVPPPGHAVERPGSLRCATISYPEVHWALARSDPTAVGAQDNLHAWIDLRLVVVGIVKEPFDSANLVTLAVPVDVVALLGQHVEIKRHRILTLTPWAATEADFH